MTTKERKWKIVEERPATDGGLYIIYENGDYDYLTPTDVSLRDETRNNTVSHEEYLRLHPEIAEERAQKKKKTWIRCKIPQAQYDRLVELNKKYDPETETWNTDGAATRGIRAAVNEYIETVSVPKDPDLAETLHILQETPPTGVPYIELVRLLQEIQNIDTITAQQRISSLHKEGWIGREADLYIIRERRMDPSLQMLRFLGGR